MDSVNAQVMSVPGMSESIGAIPGIDTQQNAVQDRIKVDRAQISDIAGQMKGTDEQAAKASQDRQQELSGRESQLNGLPTPQDNIKHVMQQSPLFMGLAALAGSAFKTGALTGLSSMNGMVKGMVSGDRLAYEDQWKEYERQVEHMKMQFELRDQIYNEIKDSFATTREGQQHAFQIANASLGIDQAESDKLYSMRHETMAMWQKAHMQFQQMKNQRDIATGHDIRAVQAAEVRAGTAAGKAAGRAAEQKQLLDDAIKQADDLIAQIKAHPQSTGLAGVVRRAGEVLDIVPGTAATDVRAEADNLALIVARYQKAGGRPSTFMIQKLEEITGANAAPLTNDANSISRLEQLKKLLSGERAHPDNGEYENLQVLQQAVESGTIDRDAAIQIAIENNWVQADATSNSN